MTFTSRLFSLLYVLLATSIAFLLSADVFYADGASWADHIKTVLLTLSTAWIALGSSLALSGLLAPFRRLRPVAEIPIEQLPQTVVLTPVYNEDPIKTFSHVAAMAREARNASSQCIHFAILSDTRDNDTARQEAKWYARLQSEFGDGIQIWYRRRDNNVGRKAGNIAEFVQTYGGNYKYMVVLDADSLMSNATMVEMIRRMEADSDLGLLQTLPKIINGRSFFGRSVQFAANLLSPIFSRGLASAQGTSGPFWGHNAIIRVQAFAESCGMPILSGKPPFGGHILSHDYVEAALLARNGWKVEVAPGMEGSYEEGPENLIDFAKRDRRWCQGNLQHVRILTAPGLKWWSRFTLGQGVMAYLASPFWALFIAVSVVAPLMDKPHNYFPSEFEGPVFPRIPAQESFLLILCIFGLLIGPKILIGLRMAFSRAASGFGGALHILWSLVVEIIWTSMLAPIMMMYQTRAVLEVTTGTDGGWPTADREADAISLTEAWAAAWWISLIGTLILSAAWFTDAGLIWWFLPITVPQILSPLIISLTSTRGSGQFSALSGLFWTPMEVSRPDISVLQHAILAEWRGQTTHPDDKQSSNRLKTKPVSLQG